MTDDPGDLEDEPLEPDALAPARGRARALPSASLGVHAGAEEGEDDEDDRPHTAEHDAPGGDDDDEDLPDAFDGGDAGERPDAVDVEAEFARDAGVASQADALGCIRCGNSCRSVYLWQGDLALFKERDTKKWVEYHDLATFTAKQKDGRTFWGVKLDKACRYLIKTDDGLHGCAVYDRRPYLCRIYTGQNPDGPQPGCGFNREGPS